MKKVAVTLALAVGLLGAGCERDRDRLEPQMEQKDTSQGPAEPDPGSAGGVEESEQRSVETAEGVDNESADKASAATTTKKSKRSTTKSETLTEEQRLERAHSARSLSAEREGAGGTTSSESGADSAEIERDSTLTQDLPDTTESADTELDRDIAGDESMGMDEGLAPGVITDQAEGEGPGGLLEREGGRGISAFDRGAAQRGAQQAQQAAADCGDVNSWDQPPFLRADIAYDVLGKDCWSSDATDEEASRGIATVESSRCGPHDHPMFLRSDIAYSATGQDCHGDEPSDRSGGKLPQFE